MVAHARLYTLIGACLLLGAEVMAGGDDEPCGVFRNKVDYLRGNPVVSVPCKQAWQKIMPKGFFRFHDLEVAGKDSAMVFDRNELWGYRDHLGRLHRIVEGRYYRVMSKHEIVVYMIHSPTKVKYYFSRDLASTIYPLRKRYLKEVLERGEWKEVVVGMKEAW
jgi:hypothetical protein